MNRNIILLTALSATLFSVVSCKDDKGGADGGATSSGKIMSAEEINTFSTGFKTKYGETPEAIRTKLDDLFASTKKADVTGKETSSQVVGEMSRTGERNLKGEYDLDDSYAHFKQTSKNTAGKQVLESSEEVIFAKDGETLMEYSDNRGNKVADACAKTIVEATYDRLIGFSSSLFMEAITNITKYSTMEASSALKMQKEEKTYFVEYKEVESNEAEHLSATTTYKFRYNTDYLPVYLYKNTSMTQSDETTTGTGTQTSEYKIDAKESITKTTFDKTAYETHQAA